MDALLSMTGISVRLSGGETVCENQALVETCQRLAG